MVADRAQSETTTRPKNANGEGGLHFDATRGLWVGRVMVGRRADGKPDHRSVASRSQKVARAKLQQVRQGAATGSLADPHRLAVRDYLTDWLEKTVRVRRRGSTYTQYESLIRVHALPSLGGKALKQLQTKHLDALYRELEAGTGASDAKGNGRTRQRRGLAPKSIRGLHVALHAGLERACRLKLIHSNPADGVDLPSAGRKRKMPVELADVQRLLVHSAATGDRFAPLWVFLANSGLRIGEALALTWGRVDLDGGWFTVDQNLGRVAGGGSAIAETKTAAGERDIPLTGAALAALRAQRDRQEEARELLVEGYEDRGLVFATVNGTTFNDRHVLRYLKRSAKAADVTTAITLHDLRRMTASLLVASGVDITTAAAIIGHKNASVLLDVYSQALRAPKLAAMKALEGALTTDAAG